METNEWEMKCLAQIDEISELKKLLVAERLRHQETMHSVELRDKVIDDLTKSWEESTATFVGICEHYRIVCSKMFQVALMGCGFGLIMFIMTVLEHNK